MEIRGVEGWIKETELKGVKFGVGERGKNTDSN